MSRSSLDQAVIKAATGTGERERQNTHEAAAQASAAKLLMLLRKDQVREEHDISAPEQEYLKHYMAWKLEQVEMPFLPENSVNITGILSFIDYVFDQTTQPFNDAKKQANVFFEIARLVELGRDQWTGNGIFEGGIMLVVDASLGETLDLVCCATVGDYVPGYNALGQANETDKRLRILSLFNSLVSLAADRKCTGGRQHDLLFLLNHVYPVLQSDGTYHPVKMIEDDRGFLLDTMNNFLAKAARETHQDEKALLGFTRAWVKYEAAATDVFSADIEAWFAECVSRLKTHLSEQCEKYGLNPSDPRIQAKITHFCSAVDALNVPRDIYPLMPLFIEAYSLQEESAGNVISADRNAALFSVKRAVESAERFATVTHLLNHFFEAERLYQKLKLDLTRTIVLGEEEGRFYKIVDRLSALLIQRFKDIARDPYHDVVSDEFVAVKKTFEERANLHALLSPDFVHNYFTSIKANPTVFEKFLGRLQDADKRKSILLEDATIDAWLSRPAEVEDVPAENEQADGINISPYQINRILLHALVCADKSDVVWSDAFKFALIQVILWIKNPSPEALSTEFKKSYPVALLDNLLFMALTRDVRFVREKVKADFGSNPKSMWTDRYAQILYSSDISTEQRTRLFSAVGDHLFKLVSLESLLRLPNEEMRNGIFSALIDALGEKFSEWISHYSYVIELLKPNFLNENTRKKVVDAIMDHFFKVISNFSDLFHFLSLPEELLDQTNKKKVLEKIVQQRFIHSVNFNQLKQLFSLPMKTLDQACRGIILSSIYSGRRIENLEELKYLLLLSSDIFSSERKKKLFSNASEQSRLIGTFSDLYFILSLPEDKIDATHRLQLLQALKSKFKTLFYTVSTFIKVLQLSITDDEKQFIFSEIKKSLYFESIEAVVDFHLAAGESIPLQDKQRIFETPGITARIPKDIPHLFFLYNENVLTLKKFVSILNGSIKSFDNLFDFLAYYSKDSLNGASIFHEIESILLRHVSRQDHLLRLLTIDFSSNDFKLLFCVVRKKFSLEEIVKLFDSKALTDEKKDLIKGVLRTIALDVIRTKFDFFSLLTLGDILSKEQCALYFEKQDIKAYLTLNQWIADIVGLKLSADLHHSVFDALFESVNAKSCEFFVKKNPGVLSTRDLADLRDMFSKLPSIEDRYWLALLDVLIEKGKVKVESVDDCIELYQLPLTQFSQAHRDTVWASLRVRFEAATDLKELKIDKLFFLTREQFDNEKREYLWALLTHKLVEYEKSPQGVVFILRLAGKYFSDETSLGSFTCLILEKMNDQRFLISVLKDRHSMAEGVKKAVWKAVKDRCFPNLISCKDIFLFSQEIKGAISKNEVSDMSDFIQKSVQEIKWNALSVDQTAREIQNVLMLCRIFNIQMNSSFLQPLLNAFFTIEVIVRCFELFSKNGDISFYMSREIAPYVIRHIKSIVDLSKILLSLHLQVSAYASDVFWGVGSKRLIEFFQTALRDPTPATVDALSTVSKHLHFGLRDFFAPPSPLMAISTRQCPVTDLQNYVTKREEKLNKDQQAFFKKEEQSIEQGKNKVSAARKLCAWAEEKKGILTFSPHELLALLEHHGKIRGDSRLRALAKAFLGDEQVKELDGYVKTHPSHQLIVVGKNLGVWQEEVALTATNAPSVSR